jgi:hypothetical protein
LLFELAAIKHLFRRFVKGLAEQCSYRLRPVAFFNHDVRKWPGHKLFGCTIAAIVA